MSNCAYRKEENCNRKRFYRFNPINVYARLFFSFFFLTCTLSLSLSQQNFIFMRFPSLMDFFVCVCCYSHNCLNYSDNKSVKSFKTLAFTFVSDISIFRINPSMHRTFCCLRYSCVLFACF